MTKTNRLLLAGVLLSLLISAFAPLARGQIFVSYQGNNTIQQFTTGGVGTLFASGLNFPAGLAFDGAGNLYVANAGNSTIMKYPSGGGAGSQFASSGLSSPNGLAFDSAGNLYVANAGSNTIVKFPSGGGSGSQFASTGLSTPYGLAFDSLGSLYVANNGNFYTIRKFSSLGVDLGDFVPADPNLLSAPTGLAFDSQGILYVASAKNNKIEKFSATAAGTSGIHVGTFADASTGVSNPVGLAFDKDDSLYVANAGNKTIMKFAPGIGSIGAVFANTGPNTPVFIAIQRNAIANKMPRVVSGTVTGIVNKVSINAKLMITGDYTTGRAVAEIGPMPAAIAKAWQKVIPSGALFGPVFALEKDGALNFAHLSGVGVTKHELSISYGSGEQFYLTYLSGFDGAGDVISVVGEVSGNIPAGANDDLVQYPLGWEDQWSQVSSNVIKMVGNRRFSVNGGPLQDAFVNMTNTYSALTQMPFPQKGIASAVVASYDPGTGLVHFKEDNAVFPALLPPVITQQPQSQTNVIGSTVTFSVTATGTPPLTYMWRFNGMNISGATNATRTILNVQTNDGIYDVVVRNAGGSVTSAQARLMMVPLSGIIQQPSSIAGVPGGTVSLNVLALGYEPLGYQWLFDGKPLPNQTNASLNIGPLSPTLAGSYQVLVTGTGASLMSQAAMVSIVPTANVLIMGDMRFETGARSVLFVRNACTNCEHSVIGDVTWPVPFAASPNDAVLWIPPAGERLNSSLKVVTPRVDSLLVELTPVSMVQSNAGLSAVFAGEVSGRQNTPLGRLLCNNVGSALQISAGTSASGATGAVVRLYAKGLMEAEFIVPSADPVIQTTSGPSQARIVHLEMLSGDGSQPYSLAMAFEGLLETRVGNQVVAFDRVEFSPVGIDATPFWITELTLDAAALSPVFILCVGPPAARIKVTPLALAELEVSWSGLGDLQQAGSAAGPWTVLTNAVNSPFVVRPQAAQTFYRIRERGKGCCAHNLDFENASLAGVKKIRVTAADPGTLLVYATAALPYQVASGFPLQVDFSLPGQADFPMGLALPGNFRIWVKDNGAPNKVVRVQWLTANDVVACQRMLAVPCARDIVVFEGGTVPPETDVAAACRCLAVSTAEDDDSQEDTDPSVDVELGEPVQIGPNQYFIPNLSEIGPLWAPQIDTWRVTNEDPETGDEVTVNVPVTFDALNNAYLNLPDAGIYNIYLETTVETCRANENANEDDSDFDFTRVTVAASPVASFEVTHPDCNPLKLHFASTSTPSDSTATTQCEWTVKNPAGTVLATIPGCTIDYIFPSLPTGAQVYTVVLSFTEIPFQSVLATKTLDVSAFSSDLKPDLDWEIYNACPANGQFVITFKNLSTPNACNGTVPVWKWDFGDGTPTSAEFAPTHTYASQGSYPIILTMTLNGVSESTPSKTINVTPFDWSDYNPTATACIDGTAVFEVDTDFCDLLVPQTILWTFPDGSVHHAIGPSSHTSTKKKVKVYFSPPAANHKYTLKIVNCEKGYCEKELNVSVVEFVVACKRDRKKQFDNFSYKNKDYRITSKFRSAGGLAQIAAKTILHRKNANGNWRRRRAYEITAAYQGTVYFKSSVTGCDLALTVNVSRSNTNPPPWKRSKAAAREIVYFDFPNFRPFKTQHFSITSTHRVKVDANHEPVTVTMQHYEICND